MSYSTLDLEKAKAIKRAIWLGDSQELVAIAFEIAQGTVSRIVNGRAYPQSQWPDGSTGRLTNEQRARLRRKKLPEATDETRGRIERALAEHTNGPDTDMGADMASILEPAPTPKRPTLKLSTTKKGA